MFSVLSYSAVRTLVQLAGVYRSYRLSSPTNIGPLFWRSVRSGAVDHSGVLPSAGAESGRHIF
jgi:hypothetical protein